jgi:hypothetical protein
LVNAFEAQRAEMALLVDCHKNERPERSNIVLMKAVNCLLELEAKAAHEVEREGNCGSNSGWCTIPRNLVSGFHFAKIRSF